MRDEEKEMNDSGYPRYVTFHAEAAPAFAHLEKVEVHLFGVSVLLFVHGHEEVLHIHHHPQQPVNLLLGHILQVGHVIGCKQASKSPCYAKFTPRALTNSKE